ncbi:MAG TPA: DUF2784 family protein [Syntrophales bacterium]|nr:DUF2784 family protein [Syntrophales bacterium]HPQ43578.1 DUF2784 family protein [Syntrophales bacterium]
MFYKVSADFIIIIHLMWILFVILGFPVFLYFNLTGWRLLHVAALIITILMQLTKTICPLTYLEAYLKSRDISEAVYPGSFIIERIEDIIYVEDVVTLERISYLTIVFFIIVLFSFWFRPVRLRWKE